MNNFIFQNPVKIYFGAGEVVGINEEVPITARILVTYGGGSVVKNGILDQVMNQLKGRYVIEFGGIEPNPKYETLIKALPLIKKHNIDYILAVGGGSVIDGSKFIAAAAQWNITSEPWDILRTAGQLLTNALPLGVVLTLPATGSEMNKSSVISRLSTNQKLEFSNSLVYPKFAILDPTFSYTLPKRQLANGLADSFIHVTEQYLTYPVNGAIQDRFAEGIIKTLVEISDKVLSNPSDYDVMANYMWSSTMALNGLISVGVPEDWTTHAIGHQLTALYGLDHGQTLTIILPALLKYDIENKRDKLEQLGNRVFNVSTAEGTILSIKAWFKSLGMPVCFGDTNINTTNMIADVTEKLKESGCEYLGEKQQFNIENIAEILTLALE